MKIYVLCFLTSFNINELGFDLVSIQLELKIRNCPAWFEGGWIDGTKTWFKELLSSVQK